MSGLGKKKSSRNAYYSPPRRSKIFGIRVQEDFNSRQTFAELRFVLVLKHSFSSRLKIWRTLANFFFCLTRVVMQL